MEETIDLKNYFQIIKKRKLIIVLITFVSVAISVILSFFILSEVYEANTTIIVNSGKSSNTQVITGDQMNVSQKLAITYGEIIKSKSVINRVNEKLGLSTEYQKLANEITVLPVKDTQIISISVQDTNPKRAQDIANAIPEEFIKESKRITKENNIKVIDKATLPKDSIKPNKIMNMTISLALGIIVSLFVIFLLEYMDNKIKKPQDIKKYIGLPLLGVIPHEGIFKNKKVGN